MTYPIELSKVMLEYSDGNRSNKFYELTLLKNPATGHTVLIRRFGKKGALGTVMTENHPTFREAERSFEKLFSKETRKGYEVAAREEEPEVKNDTELRARVGVAVWPILPGTLFDHLDIAYDPSKRRKDLPDFEEDPKTGRMVPKAKTFSAEEVRADLERQEREKQERERQAAELEKERVRAGYASNPMFGRF